MPRLSTLPNILFSYSILLLLLLLSSLLLFPLLLLLTNSRHDLFLKPIKILLPLRRRNLKRKANILVSHLNKPLTNMNIVVIVLTEHGRPNLLPQPQRILHLTIGISQQTQLVTTLKSHNLHPKPTLRQLNHLRKKNNLVLTPRLL